MCKPHRVASAATRVSALACVHTSLIPMSMKHTFALDLKVLRRRAGLSQGDCAHLLGVHPSKVSLLESGKLAPSLRDIAKLTVVYGRSFEGIFLDFITHCARQVRTQLEGMPKPTRPWLRTFNRRQSLSELASRLEALILHPYEAV
jgi:transcriptional regulator with XRE-family HTH domain